MSKKNSFVGYTTEEIFATEAVTYIIVIGSDVFATKGNFVFSKKSAAHYYNKILRELLDSLANGNDKERSEARKILNNFKIQPLRIH